MKNKLLILVLEVVQEVLDAAVGFLHKADVERVEHALEKVDPLELLVMGVVEERSAVPSDAADAMLSNRQQERKATPTTLKHSRTVRPLRV